MKLYNTLSKQIEELKPLLNPPIVTIYTCGPTVYDYPHIGNWFTFIRYDLLVRALKAEGLKPNWVMNITDVGHLVSDADEGEDKLEKGAKREGKTAWDVAAFYTDYFLKSLQRLNFSQPTHLPKATDHIPEQIDLIKTLEDKGYTYVIDDGVYYDTSKFPKYADFAQLDLDEQQAGKRVSFNPQKRNSTDFALWKFSPKDHQRDMEWDSPWGKGFPGWHIECSAMCIKYLGKTIDIHAGGIDHLPVHHTNEIAQSEAATSKPFAKYWMHTNHILINDERIAKSKGNGITLEDIEKKGYSLEAFRLLVLQSHYRSQSKFSWDVLESAQNTLNNFYAWADLQFQNFTSLDLKVNYPLAFKKIVDAIDNDLSTPEALGWFNGMVNRIDNLGIDSESIREYSKKIDLYFELGLSKRDDITLKQKELIKNREAARQAQDWVHADELRQELHVDGLEINDTPYGPAWRRI